MKAFSKRDYISYMSESEDWPGPEVVCRIVKVQRSVEVGVSSSTGVEQLLLLLVGITIGRKFMPF